MCEFETFEMKIFVARLLLLAATFFVANELSRSSAASFRSRNDSSVATANHTKGASSSDSHLSDTMIVVVVVVTVGTITLALVTVALIARVALCYRRVIRRFRRTANHEPLLSLEVRKWK